MLVGAPFEVFSRDAADVLEGPFYTAYFSVLVSLLWNLSAAIALFSSAALRRAGHTDGFRLLAAGGLITAAMALDDLLLLHENLYPAVGIPERASYAVYGILIVAFAVGFRHRLGTAVLLIAGTLALWVVSAGVDLTIGGRQASFVVEDGTKAAGVALWSVMLVRRAWAEMGLVVLPVGSSVYPAARRRGR